jgi:hypothetical protein
MPSFAYGPLKTLAENLVEQFGDTAILRQVTNSGTAYAPTQTETDTTIKVVEDEDEVRDSSGSLVGQTERTLYVSTSAGVVPGKSDKIVMDGVEFEIVTAKRVRGGSLNLLYEVVILT